jgi:AcrR family transcriptional regulator
MDMTLTARTTPLRRDAEERRERLISAAVELYASDGFNVPLDRIADRAGVSRPTLYRNFADRQALTAAVVEVHLAELAVKVAEWADRDDAFLLTLSLIATKAVRSGGMEKLIPLHRQDSVSTTRFVEGVRHLLARPLVRAKAAGLVREDFTLADIQRAILMVAGGGMASYGDDVQGSIDAALEMLLRGVAPR